jgi:hypothetical protein
VNAAQRELLQDFFAYLLLHECLSITREAALACANNLRQWRLRASPT